MTTPSWQAATTGQQGLAGHVNQVLVSHAVTAVYQGEAQASAAAGSGSVSSNGSWLAQSFTTAAGQTAVGRVTVTCLVTGSPAPWTLSIQADSGSSSPSGTALASTAVPAEFAGVSLAAVSVMLPVSGLSAATPYWLVAEAAGDASDYFGWGKSAASSGASTSPDGVTWTAQAYGLAFATWDQSAVPPLAGTWEDSGARWTYLAYSSGVLSEVGEYTAGQTAAGYAVSTRAVSYSGNLLTGVA